uniref:Uncharacterized protein n=1 Tax=Eutreptiella gymnastica TaxID=73025 RepID=A0A7S4G9T4_9EUGL
MAVKVDARVKEEYDPLKYIAVLRERLAKCGRTMASMVRFLKEKHFWNEYKSLYGEPTIPDFEKGEEEPEPPLSPTSPLSGDLARTLSASSLPTVRDLMEEEAEDPHCQLPATVKAVQKEWRKEEVEHRKAAERELEVLRLRQIAEMKEAKKAGKSEAVLANLRKSHEDELEMMKEGNQLMRAEILRQQHKEQAQALLSSALSTMAADHGDMGRVGEMVAHLQETCESKDEILIRLFDLICLREAEVHDLEANLSAIANAIDPASALQKQNVRLKEELSRKDHQLDNLKELLRQSGGVYNAASADCFGIDGESCSPRRASRPGSVPIGAGSPKMGALSPNAFPVHGAHGSPKRMSSEFGAASPSHTATLVSRDSAASPERVSLARVPSDPHHFDSGASSPKVVSRDHSHLSPEVGGSSPPKRVSPNRAEPDFPGRRGPGVHHAQGAGALGAHSPRALNGFPQHSA